MNTEDTLVPAATEAPVIPEPTLVTPPTADELASARATIAAAALAKADPAKAAMIELVTSDGYKATYAAMVAAQALNRSDTGLSYAISMMARMADENEPS